MEACKQQTRSPNTRGDVDMTSMVDVTFLLLIFFMVTASFQLQKSIEMPLQQTEAIGDRFDPREETVNVQVDSHGSFLVMSPHWELETPGKQNLVAALRRAAAESNGLLELSVQVHELAKLDALVVALDAGAMAGYADIRVTQIDHL